MLLNPTTKLNRPPPPLHTQIHKQTISSASSSIFGHSPVYCNHKDKVHYYYSAAQIPRSYSAILQPSFPEFSSFKLKGGQFKIPIVIRGPGGVSRQLGAEHSQRLESYFQSIPGIQLVACSTPYNAKGLMKAVIRNDNTVILFEHVLLYNLKERIPYEEYVLNLEEAEMVRPGEHVTILTYCRMRYHVMQAAKTLVNKGYDPEVIDIRSLKPFDLHTIGESVIVW